ncbi:Uncharacterized protein OBRU01_25955, partial [Operophtera brumata]
IWAVEATLYRDDEYSMKQNKLLASAKSTGFIYRDYIYGAVVNLTVLEVVKCVVGSPRPTFFDLCQPEEAKTCVDSEFVSSYTCTSTTYTRYLQIDSSRSFPSAHSWRNRSVLIVPLVQVLCIIYSCVCSLTRVSDHRHHWWDVLIGGSMGAITA